MKIAFTPLTRPRMSSPDGFRAALEESLKHSTTVVEQLLSRTGPLVPLTARSNGIYFIAWLTKYHAPLHSRRKLYLRRSQMHQVRRRSLKSHRFCGTAC
jgi:hypothetical protein